MPLFLIRHPRTLAPPGVCYGRSDIAVAPEEQARVVAAIAPQLRRGLPIFTSPSVRCSCLADALVALFNDGPAVRDARLAEMDFGHWEMRSWNAIPRAEIDAWADDLTGYRPGGGETVREVATRVKAFHDSVRGQDAIVICHAGSIRLLIACKNADSIDAIALEAARAPHNIGYGEIIILSD